MSDNIAVTAGAGTSIAADDVGGVLHQRVKISHGADGSATDTSSAAPLPVALISGQTTVAAGAGAVGVTVQRMTLASDDPAVASLAIIDDWDESDRLKVNPIVGQAGVAAGAGAVGVTVPRVTLASDDPGVASLSVIDDWDETDRAKVNIIVGQAGIAAGTGVDGATVPRVSLATNVALPTGTNAIGKLAANTGVDIGDVDVTSIAAGENHLGEVGGNTIVVSVTPTVEATPDYSSDDVLGGKQTIANAARVSGGTGVISFVSISSKVAFGITRIIFFKADPSATTFTENSALALNAADYDKVLGHVDLAVTDQADLGTPDIATKCNINIPFKLTSTTSLFAVCLARATINLASTSDLTFNYGILRD